MALAAAVRADRCHRLPGFYFAAAERLPVGVAILLEFTGPVLVVGWIRLPCWALVTWIVVISTVVAYLTGVAAIGHLSAPIAGAVAYVEAVATAVIAWVALGERLNTAQITGGVIVLVGAFVAQRTVTAPDTPPTTPRRPCSPVPVPAQAPTGRSGHRHDHHVTVEELAHPRNDHAVAVRTS